MITPGIPYNESERLKALRDTNLVDTPIEQGFERLTDLTRKIFDVPIAAISLIDEDRQWFKSIVGSDLAETSRDVSFCAHTIVKNDTMIIPDAQVDPRFADNPLVDTDSGIRFYAGHPIHTDKNIPIGAICIIDTVPRKISATEKMILHDLACLVDAEIRNHYTIEKYKKKNMELEASERAVLIDGNTKMWNAAGITQLIEQQTKLSKSNNKTFGLINLSIDSFNSFSDEYGANAGKNLLKVLAKTLISSCKSEDSVGYWGGKEFMLIISHNDKAQTLILAENIRMQRAKTPLITKVGKINTTVTLGLAFYDARIHDDASSLINNAHTAMEKGRHAGGNQIVVF